MNKIAKNVIGLLMAFFMCFALYLPVCASDGESGEDFVTISVEAEDDNGNLLYALDTSDPSAFSPSNEFSVPAGTSHTIYVKDAAGNITSQDFSPSVKEEAHPQEEDSNGRNVNIDVVLDNKPDYSDYEYAGDLLKDPAELGQGTVYERVDTIANDNAAERIFYTVTTDEGEVFYLVIDQNKSNNNVYLLDQVNLSDLHALAIDDTGSSKTEQSNSLLNALNGNGTSEDSLVDKQKDEKNAKNSITSRVVLMIILIICGGGFYYYKCIYKNKKDEQMDLLDAPDKDDFLPEEDEDEEADFGLDDDYQEKIMAQLMEDDTPTDVSDEGDTDEENTETGREGDSNVEVEEKFNPKGESSLLDDEEEEYDEELDAPDDEDEE